MAETVRLKRVVEGLVICECGGVMEEIQGRDVDTDMQLTFWRCEHGHVTKPIPSAWLARLRRGQVEW